MLTLIDRVVKYGAMQILLVGEYYKMDIEEN